MIELNTSQQEALGLGKKWFRSLPKQVFEISGFAGTGKTTIVEALIQELGLDLTEVLFTAFVGKAAMVLSMKGIPAKTIHSTFYDCIEVPKKDENGNIVTRDGRILFVKTFRKKRKLPEQIKLIVVDEASMVNKQLKEDILSFNLPVIALGDLHQLPPVFGDPVFLVEPDVILTEIMRQKEDNPIIHLSMLARERRWKEIRQGTYGKKCLVCKKSDLQMYDSILRNASVVLCGKNATRESLNDHIRTKIYGIGSPTIVRGDKIICRQNNWSQCLLDNIFLINGMIGYVDDIDEESYDGKSIKIDFRPEFLNESKFHDLAVDFKYFRLPFGLKKTYITYYNKFEFGYAITCHLSQGSQYDKVVVYDERMGDDEFYSKWLYTAITRAIDKLVIAR